MLDKLVLSAIPPVAKHRHAHVVVVVCARVCVNDFRLSQTNTAEVPTGPITSPPLPLLKMEPLLSGV